MPFQSLPYAPQGIYQPRYNDSIAMLMARGGDIAARGAERSGEIWGNTVSNLGNLAGQTIAQVSEERRAKKREDAFNEVLSGWDGQDPNQLFKRLTSVVGPEPALKMAAGVVSLRNLAAKADQPDLKDFQGTVAGLAAVRAKLGDEYLAKNWQTIAPTLAPGAKLFLGVDVPGEYTREAGDIISTLDAKWSAKGGDESFTLSPGAVRFDAEGKQIAAVPAAPETSGKTLADIEAEAAARARGTRAGAPPEPKSNELTQTAEANIINRLASQFTKAAGTARALKRQSDIMDQGIAAAERGDLAAGSQAVLVTFQKILDPESVVRESEYARSAAGQALLARIEGAVEQIRKGGAGVPVSELKKFARLAHEMVSGSSGSLKATMERIGKTADRYNIPRELVIEEVDLGAQPEAGAAGGEWTILPGGIRIREKR